MAVFWLQQLNYTKKYQESIPGKQENSTALYNFHWLLRLRPELIDPDLWQDYYTSEVMLAAHTRNAFQLPNLRPLLCAETFKAPPVRPLYSGDEKPDRLVRFALKFVQSRMALNEPPSSGMEEALQSLQSSIMKQRAVNISIPAYSVTNENHAIWQH